MKSSAGIVTIAGVLAAALSSSSASGQILTESQKLLASDGAVNDNFGWSVSVCGDVVVVGAWGDDDNGDLSGSAYVFRGNGSAWVQEQKLLPSDVAGGDNFGNSVSVSGNVAIVGAPFDNDNGDSSGSAYVFRWNGSAWIQEQKLFALDGATGDIFGKSVSVSGDVAFVGAAGGNVIVSGSAYMFRWNGLAWVQEQELLALDGAPGDSFGFSVSVSGDIALVGALQDNDNGYFAGSAYLFRWNGSAWVQEQKLLASDGTAGDFFGTSVSVSGGVALVGARFHDDNGSKSGSAYVFRWNGSTWVEEQKLLASDGAANDQFGISVSISGDMAFVGAWLHDDNGSESGAAYVFRWNGASWDEEQKLLASDGTTFDQFGFSVSVSGDLAVAGARGDDDNGFSSGSAYVFNIPTCGNGELEQGEECDDGNMQSGDCCSAACEIEAQGAPCNDGDVCTTDDTCSAGACVGGPPLDCDDGQFCNGVETCTPAGCTPGQPPCSETQLCNEDTGACEAGLIIPIPTVSEWGLVVLTLLLLTAAKIYSVRSWSRASNE